MPAASPEIFLDVSRRLDDVLRALAAALKDPGGPGAELVSRAQRTAADGLAALRAVPRTGGLLGDAVTKVSEHLDLLGALAASAASAPVLSEKLLVHLLAEQTEINAAVEQAATAAPAAGRPAAPRAPAGAGTGLPGGRRPLTVGSLIGR